MKRSSNRSSHATVLGLKPLKGLQCVRIADHARNLPAAGRVGGLALCAGLGFGHGLGHELAKFSGNRRGSRFKFVGDGAGLVSRDAAELAGSRRKSLLGDVMPFGSVSEEAATYGFRVSFAASQAESEGGCFGGGELVNGRDHGWLLLVTVGPSYFVTSDESTTVGREIRRAA